MGLSRNVSQSPTAYDTANLVGNASKRASIRTRMQDAGFRFKIHPAETTAGMNENQLTFGFDPGHVVRYGALVDGATDDSAAVALAVSYMQAAQGGEVLFPGGTCRCQINLAGVATGCVFRGAGKSQTILKAISATADVFKFTAGAAVWGLLIEKMQIVGAGGGGAPGSNSTDGSGIHVPTGLAFPPYDVLLRDLVIAGFGRSCIYDQAGMFTTRLENVQGNHSINHNFDLGGGNTLHLIGCYAHGPEATNLVFTAGVAAAATSATLTSNWLYATDTYYISFSSGERRAVTLTNGATTCTWSVGLTFAASNTARLLSAGYRIRGAQPVMIGCNGIDQGYVWGMFSNNAAEDGGIAYCHPTLIDCNVESFADIGIRNKQGGATLIRTPITAHAQDVTGALFELINTSLRGILDSDSLPFINTAGTIPVTFTGAPAGTSATLAANWAFTSGVWPVTFSDAEVRSVTLTNGATTATWAGALTGSPTANATTTNWRNGYGCHTTAGGAPFTAAFSSGSNNQFNAWREDTGVAIAQSCISAGQVVSSNRFATTIYDIVSLGAIKSTQHAKTRAVIAYAASMTPDLTLGNFFDITATNATAFTIANPTGGLDGQQVTITILNTSGGALGAVTFGANFKLAGAWVSPATGNNRSITFRMSGTVFHEVSRSAADVPN